MKMRNLFLAFLAGVLLMGGIWATSQNNQYFNGSKAYADPGSATNATTASAPVNLPITSDNIIAEMVKQAGPAVVRIETTTTIRQNQSFNDPFRQFFDLPFDIPSQRQTSALGSGFIINQDGYILTNNHVIDQADTIQVFMSGEDKPITAKLVGRDPELDLAVIKINSNGKLPYLKLGDSDAIQVGEWSVAIGNPYGLDHTVTVGVISAKGRPLTINGQNFKNLLQTDASINPGNSGGPLLNLKGEVIGINTAINAQGQGLGFAIPINTAKSVLDDLITKGKVSHPWIGVGVQDLTKDLSSYLGLTIDKGVLIAQVFSNSPAEKAGLQQGDVVVEIDRQKVETSQQLVDIISKAKVGDVKNFLINRGGTLKTITVRVGEKSYN
ncbi:HtrA2 peptidase [[Clostridium] ultunense Esp]|uniref:trypsin-like peptidase domain-containing protein n=1 Tax=Thermicanus aegyptius TaxID=94009 RepID=UPI0002B6FBD6|nr:trypsin-like peptidase domain-containing protein [Thermicanus aegyptius]CCQ94889.1 HtrA2 peptidase [[Clostridium] ultunense Esp]